MTKEQLQNAIHNCDDRFLEEIISEKLQETDLSSKRRFKKFMKYMQVACLCILLLGATITVVAATSESFYQWLTGIFHKEDITKVLYESDKIVLSDNMELQGNQETFLCEMTDKEEDYVISKVYGFKGNRIVSLEEHSFSGKYENVPFSFSYAVQGNEIVAFDLEGAIKEVFPIIKENKITASLTIVDPTTNKIKKSCIAKLDIDTGNIQKVSNDSMFCNYLISPNGENMLCNHRSKEYWTLLNLETGAEKRITNIDPYAHTDELKFIDETHILCWKSTYDGEIEKWNTIEIDLTSDKIVNEYPYIGEVDLNWTHVSDKNVLKVRDISGQNEIEITDITEDIQPLQVRNNYMLLGFCDEESVYYILNLETKAYKKIQFPDSKSNIQIFLMSSQNKMLMLNEKEAYLIDLF